MYLQLTPTLQGGKFESWIEHCNIMPAADLHTDARHVLVAEDNEDDFFLLRHAFRKAALPHQLTNAPNGEETIRFLSARSPTHPDFPSLLLLDLKMPVLDGFEVLAWLQNQPWANSLPVVVLSSSTLPEDRQRAMALGAHDFLTKPIQPNELVYIARQIHERWLRPELFQPNPQTAPLASAHSIPATSGPAALDHPHSGGQLTLHYGPDII